MLSMAYLVLDARFRGEAGAWWVGESEEETWVQQQDTQDILRAVQARREVLREGLKGVGVMAGPGRFSAVRVGIVYAHVIARWYRVPLYRLQTEDVVTPESRARVAQEIREGARTAEVWIDPVYDRAPNITSPSV
ncbi:MAG: TsaD protein [Patescibacteria group bacterium]|nr:TsaD protein [Patescibacteria group bacterium]